MNYIFMLSKIEHRFHSTKNGNFMKHNFQSIKNEDKERKTLKILKNLNSNSVKLFD